MFTFEDIKKESIKKIEEYIDSMFSTQTEEEEFRLQRDNAYYRGIAYGLSLLKQCNIYALARDILSDKKELNSLRIEYKPDKHFVDKLKEENKGIEVVLKTIYEKELMFNKENDVIHTVEIKHDEEGNQIVYTNDFNGNRKFYGKFKPEEDINFNFHDNTSEEQ